MLPLLQASVNKLPHFAPGRQANAFHVVEPMTRAAAIAKPKTLMGTALCDKQLSLYM